MILSYLFFLIRVRMDALGGKELSPKFRTLYEKKVISQTLYACERSSRNASATMFQYFEMHVFLK